jgi:hypothetical protein
MKTQTTSPMMDTNGAQTVSLDTPAREDLAARLARGAFEMPAILFRSKEQPGLTLCAYASCHSASSTTRLSAVAN